jgi:hypothetical protein
MNTQVLTAEDATFSVLRSWQAGRWTTETCPSPSPVCSCPAVAMCNIWPRLVSMQVNPAVARGLRSAGEVGMERLKHVAVIEFDDLDAAVELVCSDR